MQQETKYLIKKSSGSTSLRCRWQTRVTQCLEITMLYTDVDGQCDKLWPMTVTSFRHWPSI